MAARTGPLATTSCEPRQARKGAAAAVASGAGVWRVGAAALSRAVPVFFAIEAAHELPGSGPQVATAQFS